MKKHNQFQRTSTGKTVFRCAVCRRSTRLAGQINDRLCSQCYDLAGLENTVSDCGWEDWVAKERDRLVADAVRLGSDEARLREQFADLWPNA